MTVLQAHSKLRAHITFSVYPRSCPSSDIPGPTLLGKPHHQGRRTSIRKRSQWGKSTKLQVSSTFHSPFLLSEHFLEKQTDSGISLPFSTSTVKEWEKDTVYPQTARNNWVMTVDCSCLVGVLKDTENSSLSASATPAVLRRCTWTWTVVGNVFSHWVG